MTDSVGRIYTTGTSFRARAEAQARKWQAHQGFAPGTYGHILTSEDAERGCNFATPIAFAALRQRNSEGKGVDWKRSTENLLSSQAMGFNIFAPMTPGPESLVDATTVLQSCWPGIAQVHRISLEYTPRSDPFGDQSARGGVDADVRIDFRHQDGRRGILLVETKFVETGFSACAYRSGKSKQTCPETTVVQRDGSNCCYSRRASKPFRYWEKSIEAGVVDMERISDGPCPFGGGLWQPWLNYTLAKTIAHEESVATPGDPVGHAWYAVVAPQGNDVLMTDAQPDVVTAIRSIVQTPADISLVTIEVLLAALAHATGRAAWVESLQARYLVA
jgi:hypothetical protein